MFKLSNMYKFILLNLLFLYINSYPFIKDNQAEKHIVYPKLVDNNGQKLASQRIKKDLEEFEHVYFELQFDRLNMLFDLQPNKKLLNKNTIIETRKSKLYNSTSIKKATKYVNHCHFQGVIQNLRDSALGISLCNGMVGLVYFNETAYLIEPILNTTDKKYNEFNESTPHYVYEMPNTLQLNIQDLRKSNRKKRSEVMERDIETLVVADKSMFEFYRNDDLEAYLLTVMNMVGTIYKYATLDAEINISVIRLLILETDEELKITTDAMESLDVFCKYQSKINTANNHALHHDVGILVTRLNLCSAKSCQTLGFAHSGTLCDPSLSCNINEDNGIFLPYTIAHEIGHNLNASHDEGKCSNSQYIMSSHITTIGSSIVWSNCSRDAISNFLAKRGSCIRNKSKVQLLTEESVPLGLVYDFAHQCRLYFGENATICEDYNTTCSNIWCQIENTCAFKPHQAFEGTLCGDFKSSWCVKGKCVEMKEAGQVIDGQWSSWSEWSSCSRSCGGGTRYKMRKCDNPRRSNNGLYCTGNNRKYETCNIQPCDEDDDEFAFHRSQCRSFNLPEDNLYFEYVHYPARPCELYCAPTYNKSHIQKFKEYVDDGTPCLVGTKNVCLEGVCTKVGCDWNINSDYAYDYCGICGGDNSTCETRYHYTNFSEFRLKATKYYPVILIPAGARNIRVMENSSNYIAVKDLDDVYHLNGKLFINAHMMKNIEGTVINYDLDGENDTLYVKGPTTIDIFIMLLYLRNTPQVHYEYTIGKEVYNASKSKNLHYWNYTEWSPCSKTCDGGIQSIGISCYKLHVGVVADVYCKSLTKLEDMTKPCNTKPCFASWWVGDWQQCSASCRNTRGIRKRSVLCVDNSFNKSDVTQMVPVTERKCRGVRPKFVEECSGTIDCADEAYWIAEEWTQVCHINPCGTETRRVRCSDWNSICDINKMPISQRKCPRRNGTVCGEWIVKAWKNCSQSCGGGIRIRDFYCPPGRFCGSKPPHSIEVCNNFSCPIIVDDIDRADMIGNATIKSRKRVKTNYTDESMKNVSIYISNDFIERVLSGLEDEETLFNETDLHRQNQTLQSNITKTLITSNQKQENGTNSINNFFADLVMNLLKTNNLYYTNNNTQFWTESKLEKLIKKGNKNRQNRHLIKKTEAIKADLESNESDDFEPLNLTKTSNRTLTKEKEKYKSKMRKKRPKQPLIYKLDMYFNISSEVPNNTILTLNQINAFLLQKHENITKENSTYTKDLDKSNLSNSTNLKNTSDIDKAIFESNNETSEINKTIDTKIYNSTELSNKTLTSIEVLANTTHFNYTTTKISTINFTSNKITETTKKSSNSTTIFNKLFENYGNNLTITTTIVTSNSDITTITNPTSDDKVSNASTQILNTEYESSMFTQMTTQKATALSSNVPIKDLHDLINSNSNITIMTTKKNLNTTKKTKTTTTKTNLLTATSSKILFSKLTTHEINNITNSKNNIKEIVSTTSPPLPTKANEQTSKYFSNKKNQPYVTSDDIIGDIFIHIKTKKSYSKTTRATTKNATVNESTTYKSNKDNRFNLTTKITLTNSTLATTLITQIFNAATKINLESVNQTIENVSSKTTKNTTRLPKDTTVTTKKPKNNETAIKNNTTHNLNSTKSNKILNNNKSTAKDLEISIYADLILKQKNTKISKENSSEINNRSIEKHENEKLLPLTTIRSSTLKSTNKTNKESNQFTTTKLSKHTKTTLDNETLATTVKLSTSTKKKLQTTENNTIYRTNSTISSLQTAKMNNTVFLTNYTNSSSKPETTLKSIPNFTTKKPKKTTQKQIESYKNVSVGNIQENHSNLTFNRSKKSGNEIDSTNYKNVFLKLIENNEISFDDELPYEWDKGIYGPCSKKCGTGFMMRKVVCKSKAKNVIFPDMYCLRARPETIEECNVHNCSEWLVSPWSECSSTCGEGIQTRNVSCNSTENANCDPNSMPSNQQKCIVNPCHDWIVGEWGQCSTTCGLGIAFRKVKCFNHLTNTSSTECDEDTIPINKMHCNTDVKCPITTTMINTPSKCIDLFDFDICSKVKLSNRCSNDYFTKNCCETCKLSAKEVYMMILKKQKLENEIN